MRRSRETRAALVGTLYDEHGDALFRYALMVLADPSGAEDVVQQVFLALLRSASSLDQPLHYLRRAIRNECYSALRRRVTHPDVSGSLLEPVVAATVSPDERIAVESALRALPPEQREVIHLHVYEGLTFQEVADATDESTNTIASRYRYAIAKLRTVLA